MKKVKTIAIVAGGDLDTRFLPDIRSSGFVIGADRGALWLLRHGIAPDMAVGDFDSVSPRQKADIKKHAKEMKEFPPVKDKTDLELATEAGIALRPARVSIYGALGGRFDHSWGAIQMLLRLASYNIEGEIVDNFNKIHIVRRLETVRKQDGYPYLSVFPLGRFVTVTLAGFSYDIDKKRILYGSTLGVSNEIRKKSGVIEVHRGMALIVQSRDRVR